MAIIEEIPAWKPCSNPKCWFDVIVVGGLISGLTFLAFEMMVSFLYAGDILLPLRLVAMPLPHLCFFFDREWGAALIAGSVALLLAASVFATYVFVAVVTTFPRLALTQVSLVTSACVSGYLLWVISLLLILVSGFPRSILRQLHLGLNGFVGFVFAFGMVLGMHIHRKQERRLPTPRRIRFRF